MVAQMHQWAAQWTAKASGASLAKQSKAAPEKCAAKGSTPEESEPAAIVRKAHESMAKAEASGDKAVVAAVQEELRRTVESLEPQQQQAVLKLMQQADEAAGQKADEPAGQQQEELRLCIICKEMLGVSTAPLFLYSHAQPLCPSTATLCLNSYSLSQQLLSV